MQADTSFSPTIK